MFEPEKARKSIKRSKNSDFSLVSNETLSEILLSNTAMKKSLT